MRSVVVHTKLSLKEEHYEPTKIEFCDGCGTMAVPMEALNPKLQQFVEENLVEFDLDLYIKGMEEIPLERDLVIALL